MRFEGSSRNTTLPARKKLLDSSNTTQARFTQRRWDEYRNRKNNIYIVCFVNLRFIVFDAEQNYAQSQHYIWQVQSFFCLACQKINVCINQFSQCLFFFLDSGTDGIRMIIDHIKVLIVFYSMTKADGHTCRQIHRSNVPCVLDKFKYHTGSHCIEVIYVSNHTEGMYKIWENKNWLEYLSIYT